MNTQLPISQRIDKTKLEKHPSGEGWIVPMRNGEKAQVFTFSHNLKRPIIGVVNGDIATWNRNGERAFNDDLMLDAYIDPYAELKAAHAAGKVIQWRFDGTRISDEWHNCPENHLWETEFEYRIKPDWTLADHMRRFFPTWDEATMPLHRNDFTEGMLPEWWRPLIEGEKVQNGDERFHSEYGVQTFPIQTEYGTMAQYVVAGPEHVHLRTRRPLPPVKKMVQLGPEDVPPGSVFRAKNEQAKMRWWAPRFVDDFGFTLNQTHWKWDDAEINDFEINRSIPLTGKWDANAWHKCKKRTQMSTQEHLKRIAAKCRELLAIAERRTQGSWANDWGRVRDNQCDTICVAPNEDVFIPKWKRNKTYIAACAGSAEAGWRATIATIELLRDLGEHDAEIIAKNIIAAWPEELL